MKRKLFLVLTAVVCFFSSTALVKAATHIDFKEVENGHISTTIHFEDGFVGGVEFQVKVSGNVAADKFIFADEIANGRLSRVVDYNSKTKVLTVTVLAGGVDLSHNLLNQNKQLALGTIVVSSSSKVDQDYTLSDFALMRIDNSWKKNKLTDFIIEGNTKYTLKAQEQVPDEPKEDDKEDDDKPETPTEPSSSTSTTTSTTSTTTTTSTMKDESSVTTNSHTESKKKTTKKTTTKKGSKTTSTTTSTEAAELESTTTTTHSSDQENSQEIDFKTIASYFGISLVLVALIAGGRYLYIKNNNNN